MMTTLKNVLLTTLTLVVLPLLLMWFVDKNFLRGEKVNWLLSRSGGAMLSDEVNFRGNLVTFEIGEYPDLLLRGKNSGAAQPYFPSRAKSVLVRPGYYLYAYSKPNFKGTMLVGNIGPFSFTTENYDAALPIRSLKVLISDPEWRPYNLEACAISRKLNRRATSESNA